MHREVKMVSFVFIILMTHTTEQNLMEIWRSSIEFFVVFFFGLNIRELDVAFIAVLDSLTSSATL